MNRNIAARPRAFRLVGIGLAVVVVCVVAGALILKAILTPDRLRREIVNAERVALGVEPALESASLTLLPFGVKLRGVSIPNVDARDPALLTFDEGRVQLALLPLLARAIVVNEARFDRPQVHVRRVGDRLLLPGVFAASADADAPTNAGDSAPPPAGFAKLAVRAYRIDSGSFHLHTDGAKDDVDLQGVTLSGTLALEDGGAKIASDGAIALEGLSLTALALYEETLRALRPELRYQVAWDARAGTLTIEEASLVAKPLEIVGRGVVRDLPKSPVLELTIDPRTYELAELLPLVPSALFPEGRRPTGTGKVELGGHVLAALADTTRPPSVEGRVALDDVAFGVDGFAASFTNVNGALEARGDTLTARAIAGNLAGEPFLVDGVVTHASDSARVAYDGRIQFDANLETIARLGFAPPGATMAGRLTADVTARGTGANPSEADLAGTIHADDVVLRMPDVRLPVENGRARVTLVGGNARVDQLSARVGRSSFDARGMVRSPFARPVVELNGTSPVLDLNELFPPPESGGGASNASHASAFDRVLFPSPAWAASASAPPLVPPIPAIDAVLDLRVDSLFTGTNVFTGAVFRATTKVDKTARVEGTFVQARLGETLLRDLTANVDIADGKLSGTFSAPRADAPLVPLTSVRGKVGLASDRILRLTEMTAALWSGAVTGNATIDLTDLASPAFSVESKATGVLANDLVSSLTPAKNILTGTMDLSSTVSGKGSVPEAIAKTLSGEGLLQATNGNLQMGPTVAALWSALGVEGRSTLDYRDLATAFRVEDGRVVTRDVVLRSPDADWKGVGSIGFDGTIDYDVEVQLSEALSNTARSKIGRDLAAILAGSSGRLTLDLNLSGNAQSPKVTIDTAKLAQRASQSARQSLEKGLEKGAKDLLDRLGGGSSGNRDSTSTDSAAAKPDSAANVVKDLLEGLFKRK